MKVLVLGNSTWSDTNSVGNTLSNWFEGWKDAEFSFMYSRGAYPDNNCCKRYYAVSPIDIIKHILTPWRIGKRFCIDDIIKGQRSNAEENALNNIGGYKRYIAKLFVDLLYASNIWFNKKAKRFIAEVNPDIVFLFAISDAYRYNIIRYVKKHTQAKIVEFIADDMYIQYSDAKNLLGGMLKRRYPKMLKMADKLYGASELLCENYGRLFDVEIAPLYKGCELSTFRTKVNKPLKFIYAGNLYWGRADTLSKLVEALERINKNGIRVVLSIYSNSFVDAEIRRKLNSKYGATIHKAIPYRQIKTLMTESDIVLHVESFDNEQIKLVHYSFSTKIIDCLQSGSTMMVIGPKGISSVEYARKIPGAIVVDEMEKLPDVLNRMLCEPESLVDRASMINDYAIEHHLLSRVRSNLQHDFRRVIEK